MWLEVLQLWNDMMKAGFRLRLIKTLSSVERNVTFLFSITLLRRSLYSGNNIQVQVIMEGSGELGDEWKVLKDRKALRQRTCFN